MIIENFEMAQKMVKYKVKGVSVSLIEGCMVKSVNNYGVIQSNTNKPINDFSIFNACSISKFATALLSIKLVSEGVLHLDQDVNTQLKSWQVNENEYTSLNKVTLRNLLCHQSGFIDPDGSFGEYNSVVGKPAIVDMLEGNSTYCSERAEVKYEPNNDFVYSDLGYCLIQLLIEDVTGESYKDLIENQIFKQLGMKDSSIVDTPIFGDYENLTFGHTKTGHIIEHERAIYPYPAAAGLWCTSKDLALLLIEVFNSLKGCGKLNISQSLVNEMVKPQGCKTWSGLGVFLDTVETDLELTSFGWGNGYQCMMIGFPHKGTGTVILTNTDTGVHQLNGFIGELIAALD